MKKFLRTGIWVIALCSTLFSTGCGGGSGGSSTGIGSANNVTGTVFAPSGTSAIAGATVFIPGGSSSISVGSAAKTVTASDGTTCDDPPGSACASTCSRADGTFTLSTSGCSSTSSTLKIVKGTFSATVSVSCASGSTSETCVIATSDTKLSATSTKMAVVTGAYDNIEDVLTKLGFGTLETSGASARKNHLKVGTEQFTLYTGGGSVDSELTDASKYKSSTTLFSDITEMKKYSIIFINCGVQESSLTDAAVVANLKTFVQDGGRLYVTDLAFDYVEKPFPDVVDFQGDGTDSSSVESDDLLVEIGTSGIVSDATVKDATMSTWLSKHTSNTVTGAKAPNDGHCSTSENGSSTSLNSNGTIRIGDFLSNWAVIHALYSGSSTKVWIEGPVQFGSASSETRPLTISKAIGSGKVLYSSYHTSHSCPTSGQWPQERVLEYLIFEVAD